MKGFERYTDILLKMDIYKYWADDIHIDRVLIESHHCPNRKCRKFLVYKGFSIPTEYRAYGICEPCDLAKRFWTEKVEVAAFKRKFRKYAKS